MRAMPIGEIDMNVYMGSDKSFLYDRTNPPSEPFDQH